MKSIKTLIFILLIFLTGCLSGEDCEQPSCLAPNINNTIELTLRFMNLQTGEQIELVRINKGDKSIVDTIQFDLSATREIYIGGGRTVGFTEPTTGEIFEEATLDFMILYLNEPINNISNIEIQRILPDCGCPEYKISTLQLDKETIVVNSEIFTLDL